MIFRTIGSYLGCFYPWEGIVDHFHTNRGAPNTPLTDGELCVSLAKINLWNRRWHVVFYKGEIGFIASEFLVKIS